MMPQTMIEDLAISEKKKNKARRLLYCYLRMGQCLTGDPGTYTKLKEIIIGKIPGPFLKPSLTDTNLGKISFKYFKDDNIKDNTVKDLLYFLYYYYFPKVGWARPTINLEKSRFFMSEFRVLKFKKLFKDLRLSAKKLRVF
jgi:hypothetical protein